MAWRHSAGMDHARLGQFPGVAFSPDPRATELIRLAGDLTQDEVQQSPIARNAIILLKGAAFGPG